MINILKKWIAVQAFQIDIFYVSMPVIVVDYKPLSGFCNLGEFVIEFIVTDGTSGYRV